MKKLFYFISLACIALFASCSSDIEDFNIEGQSGRILTVGVNMPGVAETRLNTSDVENMVWEENDKLYAIGFNEADEQLGIQIWTISSAAGTGSAKFSGPAVDKATKYQFLYSAQGESVYEQYGVPNIDYQNQVQNGVGTSDLKHTIALQSEKVDLSTTSSVTLQPKNCILRLNIINLPNVIKDAESFKIQFTVNSPWITNPDASITYNGKIIAGGDNYIYLAYSGINQPYGMGYYFKVDITAGDKVVVAQAPESTYLSYTLGKVYTATLNYGTTDDVWEWILPEPEVDPQPEPGVVLENVFTESFANSLGSFYVEDSNNCGFQLWEHSSNSHAVIDAIQIMLL